MDSAIRRFFENNNQEDTMKRFTTFAVLALALAVASPSFAAKTKKHKKHKHHAAMVHKTVRHSKGGAAKSTGTTSYDTVNGGAKKHTTVRHSTGGVEKSTGK
jgi:hypothetical protein